MHIYYYKKDQSYYVRSQNGKLEKYTVSNNIDMILELENLIHYFQTQKEKECNQFPVKAIQEWNWKDLTKSMAIFLPAMSLNYLVQPKMAEVMILLQASIINILNYMYYHKKTTMQNKIMYYKELLEEPIKLLQEKLQFIKEISHYQKEQVSLSEFDPYAKKIEIINPEKVRSSYETNIKIQLEANFNPQTFFSFNPDETELYQNKHLLNEIKKAQYNYYSTQYFEILIKLKNKYLTDNAKRLYYLANSTTMICMILKIYNQSSLYKIDTATLLTLFINFICYGKYNEQKKELKNTPNLKLTLNKNDSH